MMFGFENRFIISGEAEAAGNRTSLILEGQGKNSVSLVVVVAA